MDLFPILFAGLLLGTHHATEPDHVAAVSSIVADKRSQVAIIRHGAIWGIGHTLILLVVGGTLLALRLKMPEQASHLIDALVGVMLIVLGAHLFWRLKRERVHLHRHTHADGRTHFHLHSHAGEDHPHTHSAHLHNHPDGGSLRTLLVGSMHGLAGSAAIVLATATTVGTPLAGLAYIAVFGLGTILGMMLVAAALSVPLYTSARFMTTINQGLQIVIGAVTIGLGIWIIHGSASLLLA